MPARSRCLSRERKSLEFTISRFTHRICRKSFHLDIRRNVSEGSGTFRLYINESRNCARCQNIRKIDALIDILYFRILVKVYKML